MTNALLEEVKKKALGREGGREGGSEGGMGEGREGRDEGVERDFSSPAVSPSGRFSCSIT